MAKKILIACPACGAKNNIEVDRAENGPVCDKCKKPLPFPRSIETKDEDFDSMVLRSDLPVLVDFWAPWCGPCRMVSPIVEEMAQEYAGRIKVVKVNTDEDQKTPARYGIRGIPTLMLFKNGDVADSITGAVPKDQIDEFIRKHLMDS